MSQPCVMHGLRGFTCSGQCQPLSWKGRLCTGQCLLCREEWSCRTAPPSPAFIVLTPSPAPLSTHRRRWHGRRPHLLCCRGLLLQRQLGRIVRHGLGMRCRCCCHGRCLLGVRGHGLWFVRQVQWGVVVGSVLGMRRHRRRRRLRYWHLHATRPNQTERAHPHHATHQQAYCCGPAERSTAPHPQRPERPMRSAPTMGPPIIIPCMGWAAWGGGGACGCNSVRSAPSATPPEGPAPPAAATAAPPPPPPPAPPGWAPGGRRSRAAADRSHSTPCSWAMSDSMASLSSGWGGSTCACRARGLVCLGCGCHAGMPGAPHHTWHKRTLLAGPCMLVRCSLTVTRTSRHRMRLALTCHLAHVTSLDASAAYSLPYLDANSCRSDPSSGMSDRRCSTDGAVQQGSTAVGVHVRSGVCGCCRYRVVGSMGGQACSLMPPCLSRPDIQHLQARSTTVVYHHQHAHKPHTKRGTMSLTASPPTNHKWAVPPSERSS